MYALSWLCPNHRSQAPGIAPRMRLVVVVEFLGDTRSSIVGTHGIIRVWAVLAFAVEVFAYSQTTGIIRTRRPCAGGVGGWEYAGWPRGSTWTWVFVRCGSLASIFKNKAGFWVGFQHNPIHVRFSLH